MSKFYIESKAGVIFGIYEGASAEDAFEAMVADGGDGYDVDGRRLAGTPDDWIILVESGPFRDYYPDMSAARAALSD